LSTRGLLVQKRSLEMRFSHIGMVMLTLPLSALVACDSRYDLGDGTSKVDAMPSGGDDGPRPVVDRNLAFPCDEWGKGNRIASPTGSLLRGLDKIWNAESNADDVQKYIGLLVTEGDLECVLRDALEDARARPFVGKFYAQWLGLDKVPGKQGRAPENVLPADRFAILANDVVNFAVNVSVSGKLNFSRLFSSARPLVSAGSPLSEATKESLAAGILSDQAVEYANTVFAASFYRGFWFAQTFLCSGVSPEPNFGQKPKSLDFGNGSYRQRYSASLAVSPCQGCHQIFDPPGFALDTFDELGRVRQTDSFGFSFDTSGELRLPNDSGPKPFSDLRSLAQIVADNDEASSCFAWRWQLYVAGQDSTSNFDVSDDAKAAAEKMKRNNGSITAVIADAVRRQSTLR
jgi:hypothetical protein